MKVRGFAASEDVCAETDLIEEGGQGRFPSFLSDVDCSPDASLAGDPPPPMHVEGDRLYALLALSRRGMDQGSPHLVYEPTRMMEVPPSDRTCR